MAESASVPAEARSRIARALCDLGLVVFLGGPDWSGSNEWRKIEGGWAGVSTGLIKRIFRRPRLRFLASRDEKIIDTMFEQQDFDWSLRGQAAFILEGDDHGAAPAVLPDAFAASLEADPPHHAPPGCLALLRPGTDGDFVEFHASAQRTIQRFESQMSPAGN